jgi:hypothetical protein
LRKVAEDAVSKGESNIDWVERHAPRDRTGQYPLPALPDDESGPIQKS